MKKTTKLRELFERPEIFVLAGGANALQAKYCEAAGFEAAYMSGYGCSVNLIGMVDAGFTTMSEVVMNAGYMANSIEIPLVSDADTAYGNAVNVRRTVQSFIRAGVAGIHIEDQEFPKKCGGVAGRRLISIEEAVGKYRAAVDAAREMDPDFIIIARTDGRGAEGGSFEEAIKRGRAYKEAGADVIFVEALQSWGEVKEAIELIPGPVMCLLHDVIQPHPSLEEQQAAGMSAALYPSLGSMAGNQANWEFLHDFKARGVQALVDFRERAKEARYIVPSMHEFMGFPQVRAWEEKYLPEGLQRDYSGTLGWRSEKR